MANFKRNTDTKEKREYARQDAKRRETIYASMAKEKPSDRAREIFHTPPYYKKGSEKK